ncbi:asparagine synthase (glutamine-hydrolysing) [Halogranum gelatinilyticum]|uniref:Asparagine synthase (Glutamine-hydrolysing) n=1 Tax=Halogranum gelatinilyticum TaxID=660521 RepID=A0A1G9UNU9_9EURY|nr:asparagine synthase-related protein [Halogranum gelatinilyticum]SDM61533.1 asparagine synthase (glutamine-hydrolysing) [Halogranum gelatinilyticum]
MPGLFGGSEDAPDASVLSNGTYQRTFHVDERLSTDVPFGIIHHGERDPTGHTIVDDGSVAGVVYGVVSNKDIDFTPELVRRILDTPDDVLPQLNGPFSMACIDTASGRIVIATDKTATRPMYYTADDPFTFGSELSAVVRAVDNPTLDEQAVSDMLLMAHVWGDKTLVREVKSLRPGCYVLYQDGHWEERRYWSFPFGTYRGLDFVGDFANAYDDAVGDIARSIEGPTGLWLSGGLDSRMLAASLHTAGKPFKTYTYNRPLGSDFGPFRTDVDIASEVSEALGVEHKVFSHTPDVVADRIGELVDISDGLVGWNTMVNLSAVFDVDPTDVGVMCEGSGSAILCGEHVWSTRLGGTAYPGDVLYDMHALWDGKLVTDVLASNIEPKDTFIDEVRASPFTGRDAQILGITHANYTPRKHFLSNKIARARVGTREQLPNNRLLELAGQLPVEYRTEPFLHRRMPIPHVPSPMKLKLMRALDRDGRLSHIPYEGTQLPTSSPYLAHGVGFVAKNVVQRGLSSSDIGNWYRENDAFQGYLDDVLRSAASRDVFDADALTTLRAEHMAKKADRLGFLAQVTTVELFMQQVLDD